MMIRRLLLILLACCAWNASAQMLRDVRVQPTEATVTVGETIQLQAFGNVGCCSSFPWRVTFSSSSPGVAFVDGLMQSPSISSEVYVTGITPGNAYVVSNYYGNGTLPLARIAVVCPAATSIMPATPLVTKQITPAAVRLAVEMHPRLGWTLTWYRGKTGDTSHPISGAAAGPEIVYHPDGPGAHHVWVLASSACATETLEFSVVVEPRRRSVRR